jgi:hypothetical protein
MAMRVRSLDVGVERITQWEIGDEFHLPPEGKSAPAFLPQLRPLDEVLRRPSLDERLPDLLQPTDIDPELLEPAALTETRRELARLFGKASASARARGGDAGKTSEVLGRASWLLQTDDGLDAEVRAALAALLRG